MHAPRTLAAPLALGLALAGPSAHADRGGPSPTARLDAVLAPRPLRPATPIAGPAPGAVEQVGEIAVLAGDTSLVSDDGAGSLSLRYDGVVQNPPAITNRFFAVYPDAFDQIVVFTSFRDTGAAGALAWQTPVVQDVAGIGAALRDDAKAWGSRGTLHSFVDMKSLDQYRAFDGLPESDPRSLVYPTLGQEVAHRWLAYLHYRDDGGRDSAAMLGRGQAHWAVTLQAQGSLLDGKRWHDNGDGTFTIAGANEGYSPLDLYAMGLIPPSQVPPWFLLHGATDVNGGAAIDPTNPFIAVGTRVRATREDIAIGQVIAASAARAPPFPTAARAFRIAFVLVTRPGEGAGDVRALAGRLDGMRPIFEDAFAGYTHGAATVCTRISAPCGTPAARIVSGEVVEGAGANDNGVLEPGEPVEVRFTILNDGHGAAEDVAVSASAPLLQTAKEPVMLASLAEGARATVAVPGTLANVTDDTLCGTLLTVEGAAATRDGTFRGFVQVRPGVRAAFSARFSDGGGYFGADLDGTDTAAGGGFAWGRPTAYGLAAFYLLQPAGGRDGGPVWFTGLAAGNAGVGSFAGLGLGTATLWSPTVDLAGAIRPRLRYGAWLVALDRSQPGIGHLVTADEDHLRIEASNDGLSWTQIDQLDGATDAWRVRELDLASSSRIAFDRPVRFRVTANRALDTDVVEAGLDELTVLTETPACRPAPPDAGPTARPPPGPGCTLGPRPMPAPWVAGLALVVLLRRRLRLYPAGSSG